jgi:hypothetical protein
VRAIVHLPEKLLAHSLHLIQPSLPTDSFASVGRRDVLLFDLLVSSPSLPTNSFTSVGRRYVLPFDLLVSSPSLPAYPLTRLACLHDVYSRKRMT